MNKAGASIEQFNFDDLFRYEEWFTKFRPFNSVNDGGAQ